MVESCSEYLIKHDSICNLEIQIRQDENQDWKVEVTALQGAKEINPQRRIKQMRRPFRLGNQVITKRGPENDEAFSNVAEIDAMVGGTKCR